MAWYLALDFLFLIQMLRTFLMEEQAELGRQMVLSLASDSLTFEILISSRFLFRWSLPPSTCVKSMSPPPILAETFCALFLQGQDP